MCTSPTGANARRGPVPHEVSVCVRTSPRPTRPTQTFAPHHRCRAWRRKTCCSDIQALLLERGRARGRGRRCPPDAAQPTRIAPTSHRTVASCPARVPRGDRGPARLVAVHAAPRAAIGCGGGRGRGRGSGCGCCHRLAHARRRGRARGADVPLRAGAGPVRRLVAAARAPAQAPAGRVRGQAAARRGLDGSTVGKKRSKKSSVARSSYPGPPPMEATRIVVTAPR